MCTLPLTWYQIHKNFHHLLEEFCIPLGEFAGGKGGGRERVRDKKGASRGGVGARETLTEREKRGSAQE